MEENKLSSKKISLKGKIFLFFTFCFLSTSIFFFIFPIVHFDLKNKKSLEKYGELTIENISRLLINPLWFIDMKAVLDICDYALKDGKINCIKLTDENGNILFNCDGEKSFKPRSHLVLKRKIFRDEINIGSIEISFYDKQYETSKNSTLFIFLLYFFVIFLVYFIILYFFLRFSFDASFKLFINSLKEFKGDIFKNNLIQKNEYTSEISKIIYEIRDNFKNEAQKIKNLKIDLQRKIEAKNFQAEIVSKDLESKLKEFQESQEFFTKNEKNAALEQFVIGISHELNTPLGAALSSGRSLNLKIVNDVKKHSKYYIFLSK
ncbi:MAG TPA: hypothetical protein PLO89_04280, partial [Spirochaetota bacterium]|nr:hypothetical protein [Spirochaetota bacterium]